MREASWTTRDGRVVAIRDMSDDHLRNTLLYLRRNVEQYRFRTLRRMARYMANAPEGAAAACSYEAERLMDETDPNKVLKYCVPQFDALRREYRKRHGTLTVKLDPHDTKNSYMP